jgi:hypothetical protein
MIRRELNASALLEINNIAFCHLHNNYMTFKRKLQLNLVAILWPLKGLLFHVQAM